MIRWLLALALLLTCVAWVPHDLFLSASQAGVVVQHQLLLRVVDEAGQPQAGIVVQWRNEWHQTTTDANGESRLTVSPQSDVWDTLAVIGADATDVGDVVAIAVTAQGQGLEARMDGGWIRFRIAASADYRLGPLTITVRHDTMPTETPTVTVGPSATLTLTPTVGPTGIPTPDWPPVPKPPATLDPNERLPWLALRQLEQRSLDEEHTNPPSLADLIDDPLYWAALTHNGIAELWVQGYNSTGPKNWRIPAGRPETGSFRMAYDGDWLRCIAFSNMLAIEVESSGRIFIAQYGGYILAECYPGTAWEVAQ